MKILPYVYKMLHPSTGEFYFGVRYVNKVSAAQDLGVFYFTSSKIVRPRFAEFNFEIVAELDKDLAIDLERSLIEEHWNNPLILNKAIPNRKFRCEGHSEKTRLKMSLAKKGKPPNNKGKEVSAKTRAKLSEAAKKQVHTDERKERVSRKQMGNQHGVGNKSRTGQTQSLEERQKKSLAMTGKKRGPLSEEHRKKISDARLRRLNDL